MIELRDSSSVTDADWVRALKHREEWAWDRLQRLTLDRVYAYVCVHCRRREEAEDVTAEVFATAVASIDGFRGEATVSTWLIGIARRKLLDATRRRRRRPEVLEADLWGPAADDRPSALAAGRAMADSPEAELERQETIACIRRLVLQLPEAQREALWLRCVDQLSLAEIARFLCRSENAVKALLHRAKSTVLERLAAEDASPNAPGLAPEAANVGPTL
ncbi:MAG: sigma-70 family RNA polymerase sigma factor [Armatimonadetes bacterium]|nr:sigma-70 family RNA polymerase sigma factor [Armatimonadota bacterium]